MTGGRPRSRRSSTASPRSSPAPAKAWAAPGGVAAQGIRVLRNYEDQYPSLDLLTTLFNQSLAHDNPILNYDESLLIFNNAASSISTRIAKALITARPPHMIDGPTSTDVSGGSLLGVAK